MRQALLHKVYFKTLHIALFICFMLLSITVKSQTILVPGDVVFVSLNAGDNSFEIIPLIDVQKGTKLYVNNGLWSNEKLNFESGSEVEIRFVADIEAGTSIQLGSNSVNGIAVEDQLELSPEQETLFLYQKEDGFFRFVYGIGWGKQFIESREEFFGSDLPGALIDVTKNYLTLGDYDNYQYYIRNGASGTSKMLRELVTEVAHWRGRDAFPFLSFGTLFNILKPPVILFDQSLATVNEAEEILSLNVAIYEHDGSKLTVEVGFDSLNSSLSTEELFNFKSTEINYSGLIGDAVYEIKLPLKDDDIFEGTETAIFELKNLSKGQFGDFVTHTLLVLDDEKPKVKLQPFAINNEQVLILYNIESTDVDVSNWSITKGKNSFDIPNNTILNGGGKLVLSSKQIEDTEPIQLSVLLMGEKTISMLAKPGLIKLLDVDGSMVDEVRIEEIDKNEPSSNIAIANTPTESASFVETSLSSNVDVSESTEIISGWQEVAINESLFQENPDTKFYQWSEKDGEYLEVESDALKLPTQLVWANLSANQLESISKAKKEKVGVEAEQDVLGITISATDINGNELIDGLEGLNRITNTTKWPIQVSFLEEEVMSLIGLDTRPIIFIKNGTHTVSLTDLDVIEPNQAFWLKLEQPTDETRIDIDFSGMIIDRNVFEPEDSGVLELILSSSNSSKKVVLNFKESNQELSSIETLDDNVQLLIPNQAYTSFILKNGKEEFVSKDLNLIGDYDISFATSIMGSEEGEYELKVGKWKDIPNDMMIVIEDLVAEKVYELDDKWEMKFEYSNNLVGDKESFYRKDDLIQPQKENRFVLRLMSKSNNIEDENVDTPQELTLNQNYPNPFNPLTTISFYIPEPTEVKLSVFNIVGQPVALLIHESLTKGEHQIDWDASEMPSGMYIYQLEVGTKIMTRKMTLVK